jgi:hypothetical protein
MPDSDNSSLPPQIVESIAIANAKSIGEQPAILANFALANQIFNNNMQQQMMLSQQQAMNLVTMATSAKCVAIITRMDNTDPKKSADVKACVDALHEVMRMAETIMKDSKTKPKTPGDTGKKKPDTGG